MQTENLNIEVNSDNKLSATLNEKLQNLPLTPGVYQFKDINGKVLYVGKAKILRNRVRQYFQSKPVRNSKCNDLQNSRSGNDIHRQRSRSAHT